MNVMGSRGCCFVDLFMGTGLRPSTGQLVEIGTVGGLRGSNRPVPHLPGFAR